MNFSEKINTTDKGFNRFCKKCGEVLGRHVPQKKKIC